MQDRPVRNAVRHSGERFTFSKSKVARFAEYSCSWISKGIGGEKIQGFVRLAKGDLLRRISPYFGNGCLRIDLLERKNHQFSWNESDTEDDHRILISCVARFCCGQWILQDLTMWSSASKDCSWMKEYRKEISENDQQSIWHGRVAKMRKTAGVRSVQTLDKLGISRFQKRKRGWMKGLAVLTNFFRFVSGQFWIRQSNTSLKNLISIRDECFCVYSSVWRVMIENPSRLIFLCRS
jgi:hypothetical protein